MLALAGGFLLAYLWPLTRYLALRLEGQQLIFMAVAFAVPLVIVSRLLLLGAPFVFSEYLVSGVSRAWRVMVEPVDPEATAALATFFLAFVLGVVFGLLLWMLSRRQAVQLAVVDRIIDRYGSGLEKLLSGFINSGLLISVTLENQKVYIGYPGLTPMPQPRREEADNYFGLLPIVSGYREQTTQKLRFTTDYTEVYGEVRAGMHPGVTIGDFEIIIPIDRVVTVNPFSLDIEQGAFDMSDGGTAWIPPPA